MPLLPRGSDLTTTLESKQCMGVCMQLTDSPIDELWTLAGSSSALDAVVCAEMLCTDVMAHPWGMTGELDGPLGQHLVGLGEPAVAALRPLLDDDRVIRSSGSREATYGNGFKYRVKDLAAFFVASIRKLPFAVGEDPAVRDRAIAAL